MIEQIDLELLNEKDEKGWTLLHHAVIKSNNLIDKDHLICKALLYKMSREAINAISLRDEAALHLAIRKKNEIIFKMLLPLTSNDVLNSVTDNHKTILHLIAEGGTDIMFKLVLEKIDYKIINFETRTGQTALDLAFISKNISMIKLLLSNGANISKTTYDFNLWRQEPNKQNIVKKFFKISMLVDKVYRGEKIEEKIHSNFYDLFSSRLTSLIFMKGMPVGWTQIKDKLQNYIPQNLINKFLENLAKKVTDEIWELKDLPHNILQDERLVKGVVNHYFKIKLLQGGVKGHYNEFIKSLQKTYLHTINPIVLNKFVSIIEEMKANCIVFEAELFSQIVEGISPTPLSLLIKRGIPRKEEELTEIEQSTLNFYSNIYPDCTNLFKKFEDNSLTAREQNDLLKMIEKHMGEGIFNILEYQGAELLKAIISPYSKYEDNKTLNTVRKLITCSLPSQIQKKLHVYLEELEIKIKEGVYEEPAFQNHVTLTQEPTGEETSNLLGASDQQPT